MKRALTAILLAAAPGLHAASFCENLANLRDLRSLMVSDAKVSVVQAVVAGQFTLPTPVGPAGGAAFRSVPAFCRVVATLRPVEDSEITIEVWLPGTAGTENWRRLATARGLARSATRHSQRRCPPVMLPPAPIPGTAVIAPPSSPVIQKK